MSALLPWGSCFSCTRAKSLYSHSQWDSGFDTRESTVPGSYCEYQGLTEVKPGNLCKYGRFASPAFLLMGLINAGAGGMATSRDGAEKAS